MLLESFVAVMALVAAASLQPGVYFAVNSPAGIVGTTPAAAAATITSWGFPVTAAEMTHQHGSRCGRADLALSGPLTVAGAPSLALGNGADFRPERRWRTRASARLSGITSPSGMFEVALFILTVLDAGTRVGRFMLQDLLGQVSPKLGKTNWMPGMLGTSAVIVAAWGYFLYQGVTDPLGGINSLWPLFGIANQLLAAIALCVGTTILIKMHRAKYLWVTCIPLAWLVIVTFTAGWQKIFSPIPAIGFLAQADLLAAGPRTADIVRRADFQ